MPKDDAVQEMAYSGKYTPNPFLEYLVTNMGDSFTCLESLKELYRIGKTPLPTLVDYTLKLEAGLEKLARELLSSSDLEPESDVYVSLTICGLIEETEAFFRILMPTLPMPGTVIPYEGIQA